jgi:hypothetical protein
MSAAAGISPARMAGAVMRGRRTVARLVTSAVLTRAKTSYAGGRWSITKTVFISAAHQFHLVFL